MNMHRLGLAVALTGALYACGDDGASNGIPAPQPDAGGMDAAANDSGSAAPRDSSVSVGSDSAVPAVTDSGAARADSGAPRTDSGAPRADAGGPVDSGTPSVADSGTAGGNTLADSGLPPHTSLLESPGCKTCTMTQSVASKWPGADVSWSTCSDPYDGSQTALAGKGMGKARSQLCTELLNCIARTGCGNPVITAVGAAADQDSTPSDGFACFCGSISQNACFAGPDIATLKGACRDEFAAASEADNTATALQNGMDSTLGSGRAFNTVTCQQRLCADECYDPCKGQPDGTSCAGQLISSGKPGTCQSQKCVPNPERYQPQ